MDARHGQAAAVGPATPPGRLHVPVAFPAAEAGERSVVPSKPGRAGVLLGEDDEKFAALLTRVLSVRDFATTLAGTGTAALDVMRDTPGVLAAVLDIMIPQIDGIEVCRQLRSRGWQGVIVLMSALDGPDTRRRCRGAGADAFLAKPFHLMELVDAVTSRLDVAASMPDARSIP